MGYVIALENTKGGVGKSTAAANLAVAFDIKGYDVCLICRDLQGTTRTWNSKRSQRFEAGESLVMPSVIGIDSSESERGDEFIQAKAFSKQLDAYRKRHDIIIIDGPGHLETKILGSIDNADLIILPTQPSPQDVWGCRGLVSLIRKRQFVANGQPKARFLLTRFSANTNLSKEIPEMLSKLEIGVFDTKIPESVDYKESMGQGYSIFDYKKPSAAKLSKEMMKLTMEIEELLNDKS